MSPFYLTSSSLKQQQNKVFQQPNSLLCCYNSELLGLYNSPVSNYGIARNESAAFVYNTLF